MVDIKFPGKASDFLKVTTAAAARGADINACGTHYTPYFVEVSCYCIARYKKREDVADFLLARGAKARRR